MFYRLVCSFVTNLLFVCLVGLQRLEQGLEQVLGRVFVCVFTYHFGMLVVGCVCNPFFLSLANQGAYFNSVLNILSLRSNAEVSKTHTLLKLHFVML